MLFLHSFCSNEIAAAMAGTVICITWRLARDNTSCILSRWRSDRTWLLCRRLRLWKKSCGLPHYFPQGGNCSGNGRLALSAFCHRYYSRYDLGHLFLQSLLFFNTVTITFRVFAVGLLVLFSGDCQTCFQLLHQFSFGFNNFSKWY